jgi:ABC-2 type transport system ATP-binding protein
MPDGQSLEFSGVTKRFGSVLAVSDFSARVEPGVVTGFLGPNGAGKTTTLRILLGLVRASGGTATIGGTPYAKLERPLQTVGAILEASSFHPGRSAANHLRIYAQAAGIPRARVDEVLGLVGLADAAGRKVGGFSLGMRQRLGIAYALLGDPGVLVLDEPTNGLDPEGIKWIRGFLRQLAREGRTVFISSHLLAEVQQTVDSLLIISGGRLVFQGGLDELADPSEQATVVDAPDRAALAAALSAAGVRFEVLRSGLSVRGADPAAVGRAAAEAGVALSTLHRRGPALEEVFLDLVNGARVHASAAGLPGGAVAAGAAEVAAVAAVAPPFGTDDALSTDATDAPDDPDEPQTPVDAETEVPEEGRAEPSEEESGADAAVRHPEPEEPELIDAALPYAPESDAGARPWEEYVKTESDLEADAFFAAFDGSSDKEPDPDPDLPPETEALADLGGAPDPEAPAEEEAPVEEEGGGEEEATAEEEGPAEEEAGDEEEGERR